MTKGLGVSKVFIELAEALEIAGVNVRLIDPEELCPGFMGLKGEKRAFSYAEALRGFLRRNAKEFEIVDFDFRYLPFPRSEFSEGTVLFSRSVLFLPHLKHIKIPFARTLRGIVGKAIKGPARRFAMKRQIDRCLLTVRNADHISVGNQDDRLALLNNGVSDEKISVIPYGIGSDRLQSFSRTNSTPPEKSKIVMVGTFDYRKGAAELPRIFLRLKREFQDLELLLLGSKGMFLDSEGIYNRFDPGLRDSIEIILEFKPKTLPELLTGCSLGIYPSYIEGFPFGVLEMHAAGLPVVTYKSPGTTAISHPSLVVNR